MSTKRHEPVAGQVKDDRETLGDAGVTLEDYAAAIKLPLVFLQRLGVRSIDNPWISGRKALAIPYRRRDGAAFRDRIWQALSAREGKGKRVLWDKRQEKLGALLYGLDQLPKAGCPVMLVDDESACHILWHHGFDAIDLMNSEKRSNKIPSATY